MSMYSRTPHIQVIWDPGDELPVNKGPDMQGSTVTALIVKLAIHIIQVVYIIKVNVYKTKNTKVILKYELARGYRKML